MTWRTYFYIKAIQLWNWMTAAYQESCSQLSTYYDDIKDVFRGSNKSWVFVDNTSFPLPMSHIKNNIRSSWKYSNHTLTPSNQLSDTTYKLSWLSARINVVDHKDVYEYDIDSFLHSFRLHTHQLVPTLTVLFLTWCAEKQQWFRPGCIVQFHIITHEGKEETITLQADNHSLVLRDGKIYHDVLAPCDYVNHYSYYHA
jgi:hypothetical protein